MTSSPQPRSGAQSVERAVQVLRAFTAGRAELRVADVAMQTGLNVSTTSRLLTTLESEELVERDAVSGLYRLGPALLTLAGVAVNWHPVCHEARPICQQLAATLGLGVNVAVRRGADVFYLFNVPAASSRMMTLMGRRAPLHATGLGKCLLLGVDPDQRRLLLPEERLTAYTPSTLTSHTKLDAELAEIAARGYATEIEESRLGIACLAASIRDSLGEITAAISVSGLLSVIDLPRRQEELARVLIEAAYQISVGLGYHDHYHLYNHPEADSVRKDS